MYPTGCVPPKFYGLPKIHKTGNPLRPIISSRGSITYGVAKVLSKVLKPLLGKSPHHIQSTGDFVSKAKGLTLQLGECLSSYDVTSLFTSVPIDPALNTIRDLLENDDKLKDRMVLSVQNIIKLLGFCLHNTYFSFQNKVYGQVEGAPMASLVSPIVANLYMESFERKPLCLLLTPQVWYRFVDDTWVIQKQSHKQALLDHINNIDPAIKFTVEGTQGNGAIPFLDTLVTPLADRSLSITVYCKPTHTDQYLQRDSHHSLSAKYSVIGTLTHRAKVVCTEPELPQGKINHLRRALEKCNYLTWAINRVQHKVLNNNLEDTSNNNSANQNSIDNSQSPTTQTRDNHTSQTNSNNNNQENNQPTTRQSNKTTIGQIVIPYTKGIAKSIKQICGKYGIQVHFKGNTTIKQILMKPKDQDPMTTKVASYTAISVTIWHAMRSI